VRARCTRDGLWEVLAPVARAAAVRGPIGVLAGVRLQALGDRLLLTATDTELAIRADVACSVEEEGVVVLPARTLVELVRRLPAPDLLLEDESERGVRLWSGEADYLLATLPAPDFPEPSFVAGGTSVELDRGTIVRAFAHVGRAAARDASRPVYTGVLLGVDDGRLTMVAMDGYRLALAETPIAANGLVEPTLVPARALVELSRLPVDAPTVELVVTERTAAFRAGEFELAARRLDGMFQPYAQLLAADFVHEAVVDRERLLGALDRAGVLLQRNAPVVLEFSATSVRLRVVTAQLGEASERIPLAHTGPDLAVAFNPRYLLDGVQLLEGSSVRFRMNDDLRPVVLRGETDELTYLVAPVRRSSQV
jgi:DNA polymerase III subunit beta